MKFIKNKKKKANHGELVEVTIEKPVHDSRARDDFMIKMC